MRYTLIVNNSQRSLSLSEDSVKSVLHHLMEMYSVRCHGVAVHLVSRPKIQALHKRFFTIPTATDCITLPYSEPNENAPFLGEIFLCPEVACTYAKRHHMDPYAELTLYLVHSFLHLMGFTDKTPAQKKRMQTEEAKCLSLLPFLLSAIEPVSTKLERGVFSEIA